MKFEPLDEFDYLMKADTMLNELKRDNYRLYMDKFGGIVIKSAASGVNMKVIVKARSFIIKLWGSL